MITLFCDNLTRIRNSIFKKKMNSTLRFNKGTLALMHCLWRTKLIEGWKINQTERSIIVKLKYVEGLNPIKEIKAISKPSFKKYVSCNQLSRLSFGEGFLVLSTDKGCLTSYECLKKGIGGMLLCYFGLNNC